MKEDRKSRYIAVTTSASYANCYSWPNSETNIVHPNVIFIFKKNSSGALCSLRPKRGRFCTEPKKPQFLQLPSCQTGWQLQNTAQGVPFDKHHLTNKLLSLNYTDQKDKIRPYIGYDG
ncbi:hypothetical protein EGR_01341 [Echinococcus granulosus]|uniref:Uncharacterized protein n=1 Tax=Echinococcus granulosus TaxID=6210 RepID=W6UR63_ECHGR|nr:hypothetical protein EGR_01341 [Echinococcus granulosus]EUB63718.1 hypothetical protein EGR_01341 [Echinococcus granulosus]